MTDEPTPNAETAATAEPSQTTAVAEPPSQVAPAAHDDHGPAPWDDLGIGSIVLVGGIGAVLVFVAVVAVQVVYFRYERAEFQRKVLDVELTDVDAVLDEQREKLNTAGDGANAGERRIPVEQAIDMVVEGYQNHRTGEDVAGTDDKTTDNAVAENASSPGE